MGKRYLLVSATALTEHDKIRVTAAASVHNPTNHFAAAELDSIKALLKDGKKTKAKKRLEKPIKDYGTTKAGEEAKELLADL